MIDSTQSRKNAARLSVFSDMQSKASFASMAFGNVSLRIKREDQHPGIKRSTIY